MGVGLKSWGVRDTLFCSLFLFFSFFIIKTGHALTLDEFYEIACVSEEIRHKYPDDKFVVVAVGRSPTPFSVYLSLGSRNFVSDLPLSSFSNGLPGRSALSRTMKSDFFNHLDRYLVSNKITQNRTILLLDYCITGTGLMAATLAIEKYLLSSRRAGGVQSLCLTSKDITATFPRLQRISIAGTALEDQLIAEAYDSVAQYDPYRMGHSDLFTETSPARQKAHQKFKTEMSELYSKNPDLVKECKARARKVELERVKEAQLVEAEEAEQRIRIQWVDDYYGVHYGAD